MRHNRVYLALTTLIVALPLAGPTAGAGGQLQQSPDASSQNDARGKVVVLETDLVANIPGLIDRYGIVHSAFLLDPHLTNPWGDRKSVV